jgi:hypothetical protein
MSGAVSMACRVSDNINAPTLTPHAPKRKREALAPETLPNGTVTSRGKDCEAIKHSTSAAGNRRIRRVEKSVLPLNLFDSCSPLKIARNQNPSSNARVKIENLATKIENAGLRGE